MRRPTAITLLVLVLTTFVAPALMARATQPTPACCRAGGRHHCPTSVSSYETQIRNAACPYRKSLVFSAPMAAPPLHAAIAPPETHLFLHEFYPELFAPEGEQPHPERAPPTAQK
jgi:hypothetical protein